MTDRGTKGQPRRQIPRSAQRRIIRQLRERDGDRCCWCREPVSETPIAPRHPLNASIEHVIPWRACRSNDLDVLSLAHIGCNHTAHSRRQRPALRRLELVSCLV